MSTPVLSPRPRGPSHSHTSSRPRGSGSTPMTRPTNPMHSSNTLPPLTPRMNGIAKTPSHVASHKPKEPSTPSPNYFGLAVSNTDHFSSSAAQHIRGNWSPPNSRSYATTTSAVTRASHFAVFKIGRKRKAHRQQAQQDKLWRNGEKGRKGKGKDKGKHGKMGQDESRVVDPDAPPQTLKARTVDALAQYIKAGNAQKIVVMTGAGISTSAGIPDFRSPDTGLYANLARLNLPYPEAVFDIGFFRNNPEPFYALAQELYPGKFRPTITHSFINLLHQKGLLLKLFTQNIDCLEREAGVPGDKIIEAHGSFATQRCIECKKPYPDERMKEAIHNKSVPHCIDISCNGLVKPDIVFFGEQLPSAFFENRDLPAEADLCIVMGTSLSVHPFASLPQLCENKTPRLLINSERVGDLGTRADDVLLLEDCDSGVRKLAEACGWLDDLEALWATTALTDDPAVPKEQVKKSRDELLEDEIEKLTRDVDDNLSLSKAQHEWLKNHVDNKLARKEEDESADQGGEKSGLQPPTDPNSKILAPVASPRDTNSDPGGGLGHVFPHIKKPSL